VVAGVSGGIADSFGIADVYVRAAFLTLLTVWGLGGLLYVGLWLFAYDNVEDREVEQVKNHQGMGLALAFLGLLFFLLSFGTAALTDSSRPGPLAALMDPSVDRPSRTRVILGVALLLGGGSIFFASIGARLSFGPVFAAILLTGLGILVAFGPWVRKLAADLAEERNERALTWSRPL
jgi:phage shock protein PspC (stress-responsive transcriptional regulator)